VDKNMDAETLKLSRTKKSHQKKVLLLISSRHVFNACREELLEKGCQVIEDLEDVDTCDFMMVDHFFVHTGVLEWLDAQNLVLPYVLVSYDDESVLTDLASNCYDRLKFPLIDFWDARKWFSAWLEMAKAQVLFHHKPQRFGSGLWVSVMAEAG